MVYQGEHCEAIREKQMQAICNTERSISSFTIHTHLKTDIAKAYQTASSSHSRSSNKTYNFKRQVWSINKNYFLQSLNTRILNIFHTNWYFLPQSAIKSRGHHLFSIHLCTPLPIAERSKISLKKDKLKVQSYNQEYGCKKVRHISSSICLTTPPTLMFICICAKVKGEGEISY